MVDPNYPVILSAARTPIGTLLGGLAPLSAPALGAVALAAAIERAGVPKAAIEHVLMGQVVQAGSGQAPARQAALAAGLDVAVGATTLNKVCGSGLRAVMDGCNAIRVGEWSVVAAGGMESMSQAPHLLAQVRAGLRLGGGALTDAIHTDGLLDPGSGKAMGSCAEACVARYRHTRAQLDAYAEQSYRRALAAAAAGLFEAELVAVAVPQRRGPALQIARDEEPRAMALEKLPSLRPAFAPDGHITAGNASKINDGAAALVLASPAAAAQLGRAPLARVLAYASAAVAPEWFTTAPAPAIRAALARAHLDAADVDLWEINEAFATVALAAMAELELPPERVNVHGGAVALGHPLGCSGARILTTLVHALRARGGRYGCAAACIGGGEAVALIVERLG